MEIQPYQLKDGNQFDIYLTKSEYVVICHEQTTFIEQEITFHGQILRTTSNT